MDNRVMKSDHYYGAFLSKVVDNRNEPAVICKDDGRGIYRLKGNGDNYLVYIKYRTNQSKSHISWGFYYTDNEIDEINKYKQAGENLIFAYVCTYEDFLNTEIAIAKLEELGKCIDLEGGQGKTNRVTIHKMANSPVLRMYGTERDSKVNGKDNTIHLSRNRINEL